VRDGDPVVLDSLEQRLDDAVAVDEHAVAARPLPDEIRVREPARMLGLLDVHDKSITLLMPSCASINSNPRFTSSSLSLWETNASTSISPAR
jgi:hypothetical protein